MIDDPRHKKYFEFIGLGLEIAVSLSFPILLGYWLDLKWDSSPLMLLTGILLGLVFMIGLFSRVIRKMNNEP